MTMRKLILLLAIAALPVLGRAQVKDSLLIRFKNGDSVKIAFDKINEITFKTTPDAVDLSNNSSGAAISYPNPTDRGTRIAFTLERPQQVLVEILTIDGQSITSFNVRCDEGAQEISWDGALVSGEPSPSGSYLYRVTADGKAQTGKLTVRR